ncbi:MAG: hypothetical protein ACU84Q_01425 [Gammaproteobacteria bacterium]
MAAANYFARTILQHALSQYYLNKEGILPDEIWSPRLKFVYLPPMMPIAANERTRKIVSEEFLKKVVAREDRFDMPVGKNNP